ncbi:choice-of-anchor Q domain-containing protein [Dokdonella sp.]|uniref:choice-of-anchor Q domain-containing protein n=1 Tax=Dokdonella sp. TaxID=2291710 RepID=UPI003C5EAD3F
MSRILLALGIALLAGNSKAANINIGPNGCTLEDAITAANVNAAIGNCAAGSGSDSIIAPDGWVVTLNSDLPPIASDMTIRSASAGGVFYILGNDERRVLRITGSNTDVTLLRVEIGGGKTGSLDGAGAGIRIENANVSLVDSAIVSNEYTQGPGSGIYVIGGDLVLERTRVVANEGGGAVSAQNASVHVVDSLFSRNPRGAISVANSTLLVERSLIDENEFGIGGSQSVAEFINTTFASTVPNPDFPPTAFSFNNFSSVTLNHVTSSYKFMLTDSILSASNSALGICELFTTNVVLNTNNLFQTYFPVQPDNCLGDTPDNYSLQPLADNGGPTKTRAIGNPDSEAINAGNPTYCEPVDQRGQARGALCDIGAYEATGFADVSVDARIEPGAPYVSGQRIVVFAELENSGPGVATNVRFDLASTHAFVASVNSAYCNTIPCVVTSIQPGQTLTIPVEMTLGNYFNSPFSIDLSAHTTVASTYADTDEDDANGNNFYSVSHPIYQGADLSVVMDLLTDAPFFVGQTIQYEARVENRGPQTATGVELRFTPDALASVAFSGCASVSGLICNVANIGDGATRTVAIQAVVTDDQFNAVAGVNANQVDININDNVDNLNNGGGVQKADIAVELTLLDAGPYYSLRYLQFEIAIQAGNDPASNIQLSYTFPGAELIDIQGCASYPCVIPQLAANTRITLLAQFFAPVAVPGTVDTLNFQVYAIPGQLDPNLADNEAGLLRPLVPNADVAAQLVLVSSPPYYAGQEIEYALRIPNGGPNAATSVAISANPQNMTLLSAFGDLCQSLDCTISRLNAYDEENLTLIYQINQVGAFNLSANADANELDANVGNNTDSSNNGGVAIDPPNGDLIFRDGFD